MKGSLRSWLWRVDVTEEVDDEIGFHIEMRTRELVDKGMDPRLAREMVLARIGDAQTLELIKPFRESHQPYVAEAAEIAHDEIEKRLGEPAPATQARPRTVEKVVDKP